LDEIVAHVNFIFREREIFLLPGNEAVFPKTFRASSCPDDIKISMAFKPQFDAAFMIDGFSVRKWGRW
jgi:hypothetical protein